jgi:hypothetical protein
MSKRPRDPNQLAKLIVDIARGETEDGVSESKRVWSLEEIVLLAN